MAIKDVTIRFNTDTSKLKEADGLFDKVNKSVSDLEKTEAKLSDTRDRANKPEKIAKYTSEVQKLKKEIRELTGEALKAGEGTKKFEEALAKAASKKAELKDLQETVNALDPDNKVKGFLNLGSAIASSFGAAQGALALFGDKSKDLEKTMIKIQGAMAIGQALNSFAQLGDTFRALKIQIQQSEIAMKLFNLTSGASPIGILLTVGAGLAAAFMSMGDAIEEDTKKFEENNEAIKKANEEREKLRLVIADLQIDLYREIGLLDENEANTIKLLQQKTEKKKEIQEKANKEFIEIDKKYREELYDVAKNGTKVEENLLKKKIANEKQILAENYTRLLKDELSAIELRLKISDQKELDVIRDNEKKKKDELAKKEKEKADLKEWFRQKDQETRYKDEAEANKIIEQTQIDFQKQVADRDEAQRKEGEKQADEYLKKKKKQDEEDLKYNEKLEDARFQIKINSLQAIQATTQALMKLAGDNAEAQAALLAFQKTAAIAEVIINAQRAILAANAEYPGPAGIALSIATGIQAAASIATIASQAIPTPPKFHDGGYTGDGNEWTEAGVVHKGEYVMPAAKTKEHFELLDAMRADRFDTFLNEKYIMPKLKDSAINGSFADNVARNYNTLDEYGVARAFRRGTIIRNADEIGKSVARNLGSNMENKMLKRNGII